MIQMRKCGRLNRRSGVQSRQESFVGVAEHQLSRHAVSRPDRRLRVSDVRRDDYQS